MAKRPVRRYEPKPKPAPAPSRAGAAAREQATQRREARPPAPAAKPTAPKIPSYAARRQGQPGAFAPAPAPVAGFGGQPPDERMGAPNTGLFGTPSYRLPAYQGNLPIYVARRQYEPGAFQMTEPIPMATGLPSYAAMRQNRPGAFGQAAQGQAFYNPIPRYGFSPSQFRSLENPPVRQGTMTKARAPVTARPYVQLEPPAEEQMADYGLGPEPFYPYPDYGGGGDTGGGGYGGYGDGGGGGGAPREVPPWYYGLVSWRF